MGKNKTLIRRYGIMAAVFVTANLLYSCASINHTHPTNSEVQQTKQHAQAAQNDLSQAEGRSIANTASQSEQSPSSTLLIKPQNITAPSKDDSDKITEIMKRDADVSSLLVMAENLESNDNTVTWVYFPLWHWVSTLSNTDGYYGNACPQIGSICAGSSRDTGVGFYFIGALAGDWALDMAMMPFALAYDVIHFKAQHAILAHRVNKLKRQLVKIEASPEYTKGIAQQKQAEEAQRKDEVAKIKAEEKDEGRRYELGQILWVPSGEWSEVMPDLMGGLSRICQHYDSSNQLVGDPEDESLLCSYVSLEGLNVLNDAGVSNAKTSWQNLSSLTNALAQNKFKQSIGESPTPPPAMVQEKYQTKAAFIKQVEEAKRDYNDQVRQFNQKVQAYHISDSESSRLLQRAFLDIFGSPKVDKTTYDPDSQFFYADVISTSPYAGDFRQSFILSQKINNSEAPAFDRNLQNAGVGVLLQRGGSGLKVLRAKFVINGEAFRAIPVKDAATQELASVDLASNNINFPKPIKEISIHYDEAEGQSQLVSDLDKPLFRQQPIHPDDYAIVVGIQHYQDTAIPPAQYAEHDANAVATYLQVLGVPKEHLILLTGAQATSGKIIGYLQEWLVKNVSSDSRVYFVFSGHGSNSADNHGAVLLPWDGNREFLTKTAVPLKTVYSALGKLKVKNVLVAIDACYSGAGGKSVIQEGIRPLVTINDEEDIIPSNITLLAAAKANEIAISLPQMGFGNFTYHFLKGLNDGSKNVHELCQYLKPRVKKAAALNNETQDVICRGPNFQLVQRDGGKQ